VVSSGATSATFQVLVEAVGAQTTDIISAVAGSVTLTSNLTVLPPALTGFTLTPKALQARLSWLWNVDDQW
jgi:hypothetical protein